MIPQRPRNEAVRCAWEAYPQRSATCVIGTCVPDKSSFARSQRLLCTHSHTGSPVAARNARAFVCLDERALIPATFRPNAPLFVSQKGGAYSPNTLQDHMATMYRTWAGIDRATSHSGRRTLATKLLHEQGEHLKTVQQVLGHRDAATTTIYQDVPEQEMRRVLRDAGESYER